MHTTNKALRSRSIDCSQGGRPRSWEGGEGRDVPHRVVRESFPGTVTCGQRPEEVRGEAATIEEKLSGWREQPEPRP